MPIRPDLRHFYRGPEWQAKRRRILERAGGRFDAKGRYRGGATCEQCHKPHLHVVFYWSWRDGADLLVVWVDEKSGALRDVNGASYAGPLKGLPRKVYVVLNVAHVNHVAGDDRDDNLKALCCWCHFNWDRLHHKETRCQRKDAGRPLLLTA